MLSDLRFVPASDGAFASDMVCGRMRHARTVTKSIAASTAEGDFGDDKPRQNVRVSMFCRSTIQNDSVFDVLPTPQSGK